MSARVYCFFGSLVALSAFGGLWFAFEEENETALLPGPTSHGHYQIELRCDVCHTKGSGVKQESCNQCHAEELARVDDSHPVIKFKDPRNAERLEKLDARYCVSCHREHQPEQTNAMGLTLPTDYCAYCHQSIGEERSSHEGMGFETCATAGCHNFHDNTALYERFLLDHLDEPDHKVDVADWLRSGVNGSSETLEGAKAVEEWVAPKDAPVTHRILHDWETTAHAANGVNCVDCHGAGTSDDAWVDQPSHESCQECHGFETQGFLEGRHGMRLAQGLDPMTPGMARIPMTEGAAHRELNCASCHGAHRFNTSIAAVDSCLSCHDDEHSRAYKSSPHFAAVKNGALELRVAGAPGPTCATCHLPRTLVDGEMRVDHNQNNSLRPNEKMVRSACNHCHGLQFTLDALADEALIRNNFAGQPTQFVESLEMAREKDEALQRERAIEE